MPDLRTVTLLGATGSIGTQTLQVVAAAPDRFRVAALCSGGSDIPALAAAAAAVEAEAVGISRHDGLAELRAAIAAVWPAGRALPEIVAGPLAAAELAARPADVVLNAVAGSQGLRATLAALEAGTVVALANKESLVAGGPLVLERAAPGQLVPVDSEHSALAQCLRGGAPSEVAKLILTASGGPFRGWTRDRLAQVRPEQALAHPTWAMGPLVTTNSATLINKGLELIEAHLLFGIGYDRIDVVVHPQSAVHSMVEFVDGSTLAQASPPDMRLPIALALAWPDRVPGAAAAVDWATAQTWTFEPVDEEVFPAIGLARLAGSSGGSAPAVFNAANEAAVEAFLEGRATFLDIVDTVEAVLGLWLSREHVASGNPRTVEDVETVDRWARAHAREALAASSR
ncbi:MAG: 1-deoxy-D-xylulose 5-phosphate reductoisomerase [Pseudonocardiales bacterium]|nr:1-deoxy-D-xylulose 5-phosphate reductoisomerase [Pseudonocardiales bacterium]